MGSAVRRLFADKVALMSASLLVIWVVAAIAAPLLAPHHPARQYAHAVTAHGLPIPPSGEFLLGTDSLGRDVLSRLIYGARVSLVVSFVATAVAVFVGMTIGTISGYLGGWMESLLMRLTDTLLAIPTVLLAMGVVAVARPTLAGLIAVISVATWAPVARIVRGEVLVVKERTFVEAARSMGATSSRILIHHIIPHVLSPVVVYAVLNLAGIILLEAALSYLGIGVQPPTASWGNMIFEGYKYYRSAPWLVLAPSIAMTLLALAVLVLGEWLRDVLDPRQGRTLAWPKEFRTH